MSILLFLVILVILIVSHEFGHFIVAKRAGIRVDEFAVGFPPRLWNVKRGETNYSVNALPLGGYVKIFGENPDEESINGPDRDRSFVNKPKRIQAAVVAAGVIFNVLLAWILLSIGLMIGFPTSLTGSDFEQYAGNAALTVTSVLPDGPAEEAGLKPGDTVVSFRAGTESATVATPDEVQFFISRHSAEEIIVTYERSGERGETRMIPREGILPDRPAVGISTDIVGIVQLPLHLAVWEGAKNTFYLLDATVRGLFGLVKNALLGQGSLESIAGPVGIVKMVGDASALGFVYLLGFTALISLNLAVINLIPVPALDGGRLLFIFIEWLKGSPIKPQVANAVNAAGFVLLMILMVVVTYHDIARLIVD